MQISKNVSLKQNISSDVTPQVLDSEAAAMRRKEQQEQQQQQGQQQQGQQQQGQQGENFDPLDWDVTEEQQKQRQQQQQQQMDDDSPDYGPPDVITGDIRSKWAGLTKQQRDAILSYPEEMQQGILWQVVNNKPRAQRQQNPVMQGIEPLTQEQRQPQPQSSESPNFEDETLQRFFAQLPKEEQIELLKLSHERQLDKLKEMSRAQAQADLQQLKIVIPKTASEELYGGSLSLLAPVTNTNTSGIEPGTVSTVESTAETIVSGGSGGSGGSSDSNKKIITFN